jgi:hypothetical protein
MRTLDTVLIAVVLCFLPLSLIWADSGIEFPGTVLMVDQTTSKFAVKKDSGGTRFTFVANDKTKFQGAGLGTIKDLKKDDKVAVVYQVQGSQYIALSVTKK